MNHIYACAEIITTSLFLQEHGTNKFEVQDKFATSYDVVEEQLKSSTIGEKNSTLHSQIFKKHNFFRACNFGGDERETGDISEGS